nr:MAG TPA: hypothetical protein [Caudoviricetes sp.]DAJ06259.1 MAG TPA: hypothetical protein [Caudoviricetes sp.]DAL24144.1 MAG TPA_asm: hypothetical protein [Caudoviricetes sp.]DAL61305.1 MAG TPA_asm: hypothetical protein [Bacteriophage sp.]
MWKDGFTAYNFLLFYYTILIIIYIYFNISPIWVS